MLAVPLCTISNTDGRVRNSLIFTKKLSKIHRNFLYLNIFESIKKVIQKR